MSLINVDLSDTIVSWRNKTNQIAVNLGDLSLLTDSAASIVAGINTLQTYLQNQIDSADTYVTASLSSLQTNIDTNDSDINTIVGSLGSLTTTNKTTIVAAINELDRRQIDVYNSSGVLLNT